MTAIIIIAIGLIMGISIVRIKREVFHNFA